VKKISFGLLELEMADFGRFWRKTPLGPLGVNMGNEYRFYFKIHGFSFCKIRHVYNFITRVNIACFFVFLKDVNCRSIYVSLDFKNK
jgi:hypothetical protein